MNELVWRKLTCLSNDLLCTFDGNGVVLQVNDTCKRLLGYTSEEIIGHPYTEFLHPNDLSSTEQAIKRVVNGENLTNFENRFFRKDGNPVYLQWTTTCSAEKGWVYAIARDITELRIGRTKLEESEQRFRALFDHHQDIVFFEDPTGLITEVNQSFCDTFSISREMATNTRISTFLPSALGPPSDATLQAALAGSTMRSDVALTIKNGDRKVYDAVKYPIKVNGEIIGVQTVARDITPMVRAYEASQRQAEKLNTILESITDGFFTVNRDWQITYINREAEKLLPFDRNLHIGVSLWDVFPGEFGGEFYANYQHAFDTGETVNFNAYLKEYGKWLKVKGYPSEEGISIYFDDITVQVEAQQEVEKLSLVASKTSHGVVIADANGLTEWVNEGFTDLTGYTLSEVIGKKLGDLLQGEETDPETVTYMCGMFRKRIPFNTNIINYKKSGEKFWAAMDITPVVDEAGKLTRFIAMQKDITERIKTQQELKKLSLVASKTNNGVLIANGDWNIRWVNEGFTRLYGYNLSEVVGKRPAEFLHSPKTDKSKFAALKGKLLSGESVSFEVLNVRKDGEEVWVNIEITPILDQQGIITHYIIVQTDITKLKTSELELSRLAEDLYQKNSDLQQFTYVVSHVLRQHGANILGLTDLLMKEDKHSGIYERSMAFLRQSAYKLDDVLRDMNTILTIRENRASLEMERVEVYPVLREALVPFKERVQRIGGKITINLPEGMTVKANRTYLHSIFHQLLSNAVKFRSPGRLLEVSVKCLGSTEAGALFSISDNGTGLDSKKEEKNLFKLYKRFHTQQEGRGIGLYLTKQQVESMGGRIEVSSREGKGTEFILYLPHK